MSAYDDRKGSSATSDALAGAPIRLQVIDQTDARHLFDRDYAPTLHPRLRPDRSLVAYKKRGLLDVRGDDAPIWDSSAIVSG